MAACHGNWHRKTAALFSRFILAVAAVHLVLMTPQATCTQSRRTDTSATHTVKTVNGLIASLGQAQAGDVIEIGNDDPSPGDTVLPCVDDEDGGGYNITTSVTIAAKSGTGTITGFDCEGYGRALRIRPPVASLMEGVTVSGTAGISVTLIGLSFTGGSVSSDSESWDSAVGGGGAVRAIAALGTNASISLHLVNCTFTNNTASTFPLHFPQFYGGAVYLQGSAVYGGTVVVDEGTVMANNRADRGGALALVFQEDTPPTSSVLESATATQTRLSMAGTVADNAAYYIGGGVYVKCDGSPSNVAVVVAGVVANNTAEGWGGGVTGGGGLYVGFSGDARDTTVVVSGRVSGNVADGSDVGGAGLSVVYQRGAWSSTGCVARNTSVILTASGTISGNVMKYIDDDDDDRCGGGIYVSYQEAVAALDTTISFAGAIIGNTAGTAARGGGAFVTFGGITNNTILTASGSIQGNEAAGGGGLTVLFGDGASNVFVSVSGNVIGNTAGASVGGGLFIGFTSDTTGDDYGGGVHGVTVLVNGTVVGNTARGSGGGLIVNFGGMGGTVTDSAVTISGNVSNNIAGIHGGGAEIFGYMADGFGINVDLSGSAFSQNYAGTFGGAVHLSMTSSDGAIEALSVTATNAHFHNNLASEVGGGVYVSLDSTFVASAVSLVNSTFLGNGAGACLVKFESGLKLAQQTLLFPVLPNGVSLHPVINEVPIGIVTPPPLLGATVTDTPFSLLSLSGEVQRAYAQIAFECLLGHYTKNSTAGSLSRVAADPTMFVDQSQIEWNCVPCPTGTYSRQRSTFTDPDIQCLRCPDGAVCSAGADDIVAKRGFTGYSVNETHLAFARCPDGYCCPNETCPPFFCERHRTGTMCGSCLTNFSEAFGVIHCVPDSDCYSGRWMLPLALFLSGALVALLVWWRSKPVLEDKRRRTQLRQSQATAIGNGKVALVTNDSSELVGDGDVDGDGDGRGVVNDGDTLRDHHADDDGAELKAVTFFYQIAPLVLSAETSTSQSGFSQALTSFFNVRVSSVGGGGGRGLCAYKGMTATQKLASSYILPSMLLGWMGVAFAVWAAVVCIRERRNNGRRLSNTDGTYRYRGFAGHFAALFEVLGFSFSTLLVTTTSLVSCIKVNTGDWRLFMAGDVACWTSWQKAIMGTVLPLLLLYPLLLIWLVIRARRICRSRDRLGSSMQGIMDNIATPYRNGLVPQCWESVLMTQRMLLVLVSVFASAASPVWRAWAITLILLVCLIAQIVWRPFRRSTANLTMSLFLSFLVAVAAWEVGSAVMTSQGATFSSETIIAIGAFVSVFMAVPFTLSLSLQVMPFVAAAWDKFVEPRLPHGHILEKFAARVRSVVASWRSLGDGNSVRANACHTNACANNSNTGCDSDCVCTAHHCIEQTSQSSNRAAVSAGVSAPVPMPVPVVVSSNTNSNVAVRSRDGGSDGSDSVILGRLGGAGGVGIELTTLMTPASTTQLSRTDGSGNMAGIAIRGIDDTDAC